ncbi:uncharacterized protein CBL_03723 [Carabus blaptoides fortunei]
MLKESKNKRKWQSGENFVLPNIPLPTTLAQGATEGKKSANSKRVAVLNKLFMKYITDLMATGENAAVFLGKGLEINRHAGTLRHELSQLRVVGVVPMIHFVKDREYAKLIEVDIRLAKADFGDDYVPVEPSYKFRSNFYLNTTLPETVKEQIQALEGDDSCDNIEESLPSMRMDVLGLNHTDIMTKVQKGIKKSQALHRKSTEIKDKNIPISMNEDPIQYTSNKQQREAFTQFLIKRQILQAKAKREKDKYSPEYEFLRAESAKYYEDTPFSAELHDADFDYIEEQEDNKKL